MGCAKRGVHASRGWRHGCTGECRHRSVTADGRALLHHGQSAETCPRGHPGMGEGERRERNVTNLVKLPGMEL